MPCQPMATVLTLQGFCDCHIMFFSESSTVSRKCLYTYQRCLVQALSENYELAWLAHLISALYWELFL